MRKWWVIARHPRATIIFEEPLYLGPRFSLHMPKVAPSSPSASPTSAETFHDVPAYCLAAGVPARLHDYYGLPGEEPPELAGRDGQTMSGRR